MTKTKPILILAGLMLAACSEQASMRDYVAEIGARNAEFEAAYNRGDAASVGAMYTEDAIIMPPGEPILKGAEAGVALWQGKMESGLAKVDFTDGEIIGMGDAAINQGNFIAYDAEGNRIATGKYLVFWKFVDGQWKLHHDIWNFDS